MFDSFDKKVRFPHNLDGILSNSFNYKTGAFYDYASEDYRTRINLCYDALDDDLRIELIDFVEDYLPFFKAEISNQKRKLKIENENSDYAKDYLFAFTKLKYKFFSKWAKQKRKELKNSHISLKDKNTNSDNGIKVYKWHILIEPIVSGAISDIQTGINRPLEKTELSRLVVEKLNLDIKVSDIEPYIQYSFIDNQDRPKNLFSKNKLIAIYKYCVSNEIEIKDVTFLAKARKYIDF